MQKRLPKLLQPPATSLRPRSAFTLIEMMIVITILIILVAITIPIVRDLNRNERVKGTSRQVRSFLQGATDRALQSELPRGVRFLLDENDNTSINRLVYIGPAGNLSLGSVQVTTTPTSGGRRRLSIAPSSARATWNRLRTKGLIPNGSIIKLKNVAGGTFTTYTIIHNGTDWLLTKDFLGAEGAVLNGNNGDYQLELGNSVLPNQEPRLLEAPIDLTNSQVPNGWKAGGVNFRRDILFSPRGNVIGPAAAIGHIHLVITSPADKLANLAPGDPNKQDPETIVTITTQTGSVNAHSVHIGAIPPDPFRNAETGVESE